MTSYMDGFYKRLEELAVVPVVVLDRVEDAVPLARALSNGGLPSAEVTFRTQAAAASIAAIAEACPETLVGAGTIISVDQAEAAVVAGARFIVSPGHDMGVVRWCLERKVPIIPAGVTPTEVTELVNASIDVTKFFPAALYGGLPAIQALASVFVGHRFMPTGGVNADNLAEYLADPAVIACGGTWVAKPAMIAAGRFDEVERLSREAAATARRVRG